MPSTALHFDWRSAVVYQIYPRSFCDSNGDGVGDLPGITSKLDYLQALGVQVVWLSPIYASPNDDNGYDISDYRAIMAEFGSMADFEAMLAGLHDRGIRLMMDLVVNHTSDEHTWFVQARSSRDNPFHDYYIWADPMPNGSPPTNWEAAFQGSVWTWNEPTGEYYLHMFSAKQPDLNWENPKVRHEVYALMRFWLDKGVDGFRMDVINMISKPWDAQGRLPQAPVVRDGFLQPSFAMTCNGPRLNEFLREMRSQVLDHYDTLTVGEAPLATVQQGRDITHPHTGALNMLFQFEHMDLDSVGGHVNGKWARKALDWRDMKACMARWQTALQGSGWNSLYLCNHDQPRSVSRFGAEGVLRETSAKALATWLHGMQGTPFIYQGEELGMTNVAFERIEDYRDIETLNYYRVATQRGQSHQDIMASIHAVGRDNARTPMPWDSGQHAGFTSGQPWIALNPDCSNINAQAAQLNPDSVFHHYRKLVALRQQWPIFREGRFELLAPEDPQVCAYVRHWGKQTLFVVANMSVHVATMAWPQSVSSAQVMCLLASPSEANHLWGQALHLQPYEALMLLCE